MLLVVGDNFTDGMAKNHSYYCRGCNSAKGKAHYARHAQKYLDMQRARLKNPAEAEKRAEYGRSFYSRNKSRWVAYRATQKNKENSDPWVRAGRILMWTRRRAAERGMEFDLTREWIADRLVGGVCCVTGIAFDLGRDESQRFNPWGPSIDRIDSAKGYTKDNCRAVVWIYNMAKSEWSDDVVVVFAKALAGRAGF